MRRRIFLWTGLVVLFASWIFCSELRAKETYRVNRGDTISSISEKFDITPEALKSANGLKGDKLKHKQRLTIPTAQKTGKIAKAPASRPAPPREEAYRVKKGDTLASISKKTGVSIADLRDFNRLKGKALKVGQKIALKPAGSKTAPLPAATVEIALKPSLPEMDEEEEDGGLAADERAWAEIEKRKQDNAALLGNWSNPEEPKLLVKVAMGFLGAPYRLGGSTVTGIDCSAFVKKIYQVFNITLPRTAAEQSHVGLPVSRSELTEGDLLFFNTRRNLGHVGIYIGNNEFVHASSRKRGVRVDNLDTPYFNKRFVRAVRLKGSDEGL
jgi:cell wall-associated NlpC family hydrolase